MRTILHVGRPSTWSSPPCPAQQLTSQNTSPGMSASQLLPDSLQETGSLDFRISGTVLQNFAFLMKFKFSKKIKSILLYSFRSHFKDVVLQDFRSFSNQYLSVSTSYSKIILHRDHGTADDEISKHFATLSLYYYLTGAVWLVSLKRGTAFQLLLSGRRDLIPHALQMLPATKVNTTNEQVHRTNRYTERDPFRPTCQ